MSKENAFLTAQQKSDLSLMKDTEKIKNFFSMISRNDDIKANNDLVRRIGIVLSYLPGSVKEIEKNREEIRDVVFSGFSLIDDIKLYLYGLRIAREKKLLEYQQV